MSPRAAWRLEALGFADVYDYEAGKQDWAAMGLPLEGKRAQRPRAGDVAVPEVPTCSPDEPLSAARERARASGFDVCIVVNDRRVVQGLLGADELGGRDERVVADAMRPGPGTYRPNVDVEEMAEVMAKHDLASAPVTTSDGVLVGLLRREDAERVAHRLHERIRTGEEDAGSD
jgi:CBS domain-containing protein